MVVIVNKQKYTQHTQTFIETAFFTKIEQYGLAQRLSTFQRLLFIFMIFFFFFSRQNHVCIPAKKQHHVYWIETNCRMKCVWKTFRLKLLRVRFEKKNIFIAPKKNK